MATSLPVGAYQVTAEAPGFKRYLEQNIQLQVDENRQVNITLQACPYRKLYPPCNAFT